jgi:hypothetical protein
MMRNFLSVPLKGIESIDGLESRFTILHKKSEISDTTYQVISAKDYIQRAISKQRLASNK